MGRPKRYATESEKQKAYRQRKKNLSGENRRTRGSVDAVERTAASEGELAATTSAKSVEWTSVASAPAQTNLPVPVLAEPKTHPAGISNDKAEEVSEARESTNVKVPGNIGRETSRGGQFVYDKKKYPNRGAWEIAAQRTERAIRYFSKFPDRFGAEDLKQLSLDWQYQNEGIKGSCK